MSRIDAPRAASRRGRPSAVPPDAGRSVGRTATLVGLGVVVVGVLVALALMNPGPSLPTRLQDGLTLSISVLIESLPFVVLGVLLSIVVQVWVPPGVIERWMPRAAWARRAVLSLLGMLIPVCECGNVPFARGLMMRGFGVSETMTFLIAAPIVNPIVIITTHRRSASTTASSSRGSSAATPWRTSSDGCTAGIPTPTPSSPTASATAARSR